MRMSVREAKAKFSAAIAAAERGESVTITKHGKVVAELNPPNSAKQKLNFAAADSLLRSRGLDRIEVDLPDYFDDAGYSREVLGLQD